VLALHPANFLLLDEPTNHLDIEAQEMLEDTLRAFPGTVLMVSHDRYLIDRLATQVWELRDGEPIRGTTAPTWRHAKRNARRWLRDALPRSTRPKQPGPPSPMLRALR